ncbi:hypothetical protein [Pantoea sp. B65]|uniref:hypothetical protein n=1 Tax=Pantoea sp. B65 TaxID=2813359 RepID=UPI0039B63FFD
MPKLPLVLASTAPLPQSPQIILQAAPPGFYNQITHISTIPAAPDTPQRRNGALYSPEPHAEPDFLSGISRQSWETLQQALVAVYNTDAPDAMETKAIFSQMLARHQPPTTDQPFLSAASRPQPDPQPGTSTAAVWLPAAAIPFGPISADTGEQNHRSPPEDDADSTASDEQRDAVTVYNWVSKHWGNITARSRLERVKIILGLDDKPQAVSIRRLFNALQAYERPAQVTPPSLSTIRNAFTALSNNATPQLVQWVQDNLLQAKGSTTEDRLRSLLKLPVQPPGINVENLAAALKLLHQQGLLVNLGFPKGVPGLSVIRLAFARAPVTISNDFINWVNTHWNRSPSVSAIKKVMQLQALPDRPAELNAVSLYEALEQLLGVEAPGITTLRNAFTAPHGINLEMQQWLGSHWRRAKGTPLEKLSALLAREDLPAGISPKIMAAMLQQIARSASPGISLIRKAFYKAGFGINAEVAQWASSHWPQAAGISSTDKVAALLQMPGKPLIINASMLYGALVWLYGDSAPGETSVNNAFIRQKPVTTSQQQQQWVRDNFLKYDGHLTELNILILLLQPGKPSGLDVPTLFSLLQTLNVQQLPLMNAVRGAFSLLYHFEKLQKVPGEWTQLANWVKVNWKLTSARTIEARLLQLLQITAGKPAGLTPSKLCLALVFELGNKAPGIDTIRNAINLFRRIPVLDARWLHWLHNQLAAHPREQLNAIAIRTVMEQPDIPAPLLDPKTMHAAIAALYGKDLPVYDTVRTASGDRQRKRQRSRSVTPPPASPEIWPGQ